MNYIHKFQVPTTYKDDDTLNVYIEVDPVDMRFYWNVYLGNAFKYATVKGEGKILPTYTDINILLCVALESSLGDVLSMAELHALDDLDRSKVDIIEKFHLVDRAGRLDLLRELFHEDFEEHEEAWVYD